MRRYARYLYDEGYKKGEIRRELEDFLIRCDPSANRTQWSDTIDRIVKNCDARPLIEIDGVSITKREMERIDALGGRMARRLMFTLVCLAKYRNAVRPGNDSWVPFNIRDVFRLANVKLSTTRQALMVNDLYTAGYVGYNRKVDNTNVRVLIVDDSDDCEVYINDFRNLGNQYELLNGGNYIHCQECDAVVRRTSNKQKYCVDCMAAMHKSKVLENYHSVA